MIDKTIIEKFKARFDREVVYVMKSNKIPGMSVKVTMKGESIYERNYGSRELDQQKPTTSDTIYGIASMTKSITCLAILLLQQQGKLNIHDPIEKYVPVRLGFKENPITIHHLMCHGSGMPDFGTYVFPIINEGLNIQNTVNIPMNNWDDFYFHMNDAYKEIISKPGERFYYSNDGFTILSQIVEKVSGSSYENFVKQNILEKLEMTRSTFSRDELKSMEDVSKGYDDTIENKKLNRKPKPHTTGPFNSGAGGLNSSVNDLSKYLSFHLNKGMHKDKRIISDELIQKMYEPHNPHSKNSNFLFGFKDEVYGYGLSVIGDFFGKKIIYHSGSSGVSGGVYCFVPELELTYVQLQNITSSPNYLFVLALSLLFGHDPDKNIPYFIRRKHFSQLTGNYTAYKNILEIEIKEKDYVLYLQEKGDENVFPLIPSNSDPDCMDFYIIQGFGKLDIPFKKFNNEIVFDFERNLMHKKGSFIQDFA